MPNQQSFTLPPDIQPRQFDKLHMNNPYSNKH